MDINLITLFLAIYGAILSTILGLGEIKKGSKKISIFLIHDQWSMSYSITITNIGHRPITLVGLAIVTKLRELVPNSALRAGYIDEEAKWEFPITLSDGDHTSLSIASQVSEVIFNEGIKKIIVFDVEGNRYDKYEKLIFDSKTGMYEKIK